MQKGGGGGDIYYRSGLVCRKLKQLDRFVGESSSNFLTVLKARINVSEKSLSSSIEMEGVRDLEVFRQNWREELKKKQLVGDRGNAGGESSKERDSLKSELVATSPNSQGVSIKFNDNIISPSSKPDHSCSKPEIAYYPFDIVCNLLKFERNVDQHENLNFVPVKHILKTKRPTEQQTKDKTAKKLKLKDIFSDKLPGSGGETKERILDKFLSDLVKFSSMYTISASRVVCFIFGFHI